MVTGCDGKHENVGTHSPFLCRKLRALGCPFDYATDWEAVRDIVVWLEEEKIRLYPRRRRIPLRTVDSAKEWWSMMKQYCRDIEVPLSDNNTDSGGCALPHQLASLLETLTSVAIGDVYQDAVEVGALTSYLPEENQTDSSRPVACPATPSAVTQEELQTALRPLFALLQLPPFQEHHAADYEIISACEAVAIRLRSCSPWCAKMERSVPPSDEDLQHAANRVLVAMPFAGRGIMHFLTRYLSGLRALHISVMRDTHERLDVIVEALQTLIGNPVTDSKLGKVGV